MPRTIDTGKPDFGFEFGLPIREEGTDIEKTSESRFLGFEASRSYRRHMYNTIGVTSWVIPYWWLVTPPTLLAAYLLLRKPRPKSPSL